MCDVRGVVCGVAYTLSRAYNSFIENEEHLRIAVSDDKCVCAAVDMGILLMHDGAHVESSRKTLVHPRGYVSLHTASFTFDAVSFALNALYASSALELDGCQFTHKCEM